jgi:TPR repeat protein
MSPGSDSTYRPAVEPPAQAAITRLCRWLPASGLTPRNTRSATTKAAIARVTRTLTRTRTRSLQTATMVEAVRQRAESGDAEAQVELGLRYLFGRGLPQDKVQGRRWCRCSAEQGHPEGMLQLGSCYYNGDGGSRDLAKAYVWFVLAAGRGLKEAKRIRDLVAPQLDAAQLQAARTVLRTLRQRPPPA